MRRGGGGGRNSDKKTSFCKATFPHSIVIRAEMAAEEAAEREKERGRERRGRVEVKVGHNSLRQAVEGRELHKITSEREKQGAGETESGS